MATAADGAATATAEDRAAAAGDFTVDTAPDGSLQEKPAAGVNNNSGAPASDFNTVWFLADVAPAAAASSSLEQLARSLRQRSQQLGLQVAPNSPWRVRLTEVPIGNGEAHLLKVDGLLTEGGHTARIFTFLRNDEGQAPDFAREILWTISTHVLKPYHVTRRGGAWSLDDGVPKLWGLAPGRTLFDTGGMPYRVVADGPERRRLAPSDTEPCAAGDACVVTAAGSGRSPPVPGWQHLRLKVLGSDQGVTVYVSGYEAHQVQDRLYEYWGAPANGANVTALRSGRLVYRGRITADGGTLPSIVLPSPALSRR
jgi:hypothetical protein